MTRYVNLRRRRPSPVVHTPLTRRSIQSSRTNLRNRKLQLPLAWTAGWSNSLVNIQSSAAADSTPSVTGGGSATGGSDSNSQTEVNGQGEASTTTDAAGTAGYDSDASATKESTSSVVMGGFLQSSFSSSQASAGTAPPTEAPVPPPPVPRGEQTTGPGPYTVTDNVADCGTFQPLRPLFDAGTSGIVDLTTLPTESTAVPSWKRVCEFRQYGDAAPGFPEVSINQAANIALFNPTTIISFWAYGFGLDFSDANADAFFWNTGSSCIASFETVNIDPGNGQINVQVELYPNGDFDIRWGTFEIGNTILDIAEVYAGINSFAPNRPAAPAIGPGFDSDGTSYGVDNPNLPTGSTNTLDKVQNTCNAFFATRV